MKSVFIILLLSIFTGISVFGIFAMNHGSGHDGCIAAIVQGTDCPKEENSVSFLNFHFDAFRSFSTATFGDNFASVLTLLVALVLIVAFGVITGIQPSSLAVVMNYRSRQFLESRSFPFQRKLVHWLALHENSPAPL